MNDLNTLQGEQCCLSCKKRKPLIAFSLQKGKTHKPKGICQECEQCKRYEQYCRVAAQREISQKHQQEREEARQKTWERRILLRQQYERHDQELEGWYQQQADRHCRTCRQLLPASAFGVISSTDGFMLYTRCKICHEAMLERRQLPCCLCQRKTPRQNFLSRWNGFELCGDDVALSLCCQTCEAALCALPENQRTPAIQSCCQRTFPADQIIYAEIDPETRGIRYIGRTGRPGRRHAQHLLDRSPQTALWGSERAIWYTRRNWMHALAEKGLAPSMKILRIVETAPLVLEWEQRFIFHGIQHGWKLLNWQIMDQELVAHIRASAHDFFTVPFDVLVQERFFSPYGLLAFLHAYVATPRTDWKQQ